MIAVVDSLGYIAVPRFSKKKKLQQKLKINFIIKFYHNKKNNYQMCRILIETFQSVETHFCFLTLDSSNSFYTGIYLRLKLFSSAFGFFYFYF
jgi:hypothetical protein